MLQQFQEEIAALKQRIETLESQISAFQAGDSRADDEAVDFTDIEIGVDVPNLPAEEPVPVPAEEPVPVPVEEPVPEPEPVVDPVPAAEPEPLAIPGEASVSPKSEDETARLPWRTDKPGISVKNIRSGISLLDRALFIGTLFKEDFALYDQTIADLNAMSSLDEAVDYIRRHFPSWNLKSDVVYHFMMSVRKKLG